ncbi:hypothetical protein CesoFtcFv8_022955 [Champsocephalus esox]|uniref:Uncharacterized protein n=1 Tax=Champsocephalus esox TaxID=159716 RepID=A0AAN8GGC0_9TELE|nr:hypothetical protein CesoFtcFv8_022955 [Champsocephalus esox]
MATSYSACVTWTLERILCKRHSKQYALYFVMESAFDFSELDMEHLRRWWCMLLIDNFPVTFEGRKTTHQPKDDWRGKTAKTVPGKRTHWQRWLQKKFLSALKRRMERSTPL